MTSSSCGRPRSRKLLLRTPQRPVPPGKVERERRVFVGVETDGETEIAGAAAEEFVDRLAEQIFAGAIDQAEAAIGIEGENGDVDLGHDGAKKGGGFKGAEPLHAQSFAELIDLEQDLAEGIVGPRAAGANRVIAFAEGGEQVAHGLERPDDVFARAGEKCERATADQEGQGPDRPWR